METLPIRLMPGQDLRRAIEDAVASRGCAAAFVLSGIGSLARACLRFAGALDPQQLIGDIEILSLAGTIAQTGSHSGPQLGSHLHTVLSTSAGDVLGGHVAPGCIVRTTAEVLLVLLPDWHFRREPDASTGFDELVVRRLAGPGGAT